MYLRIKFIFKNSNSCLEVLLNTNKGDQYIIQPTTIEKIHKSTFIAYFDPDTDCPFSKSLIVQGCSLGRSFGWERAAIQVEEQKRTIH